MQAKHVDVYLGEQVLSPITNFDTVVAHHDAGGNPHPVTAAAADALL